MFGTSMRITKRPIHFAFIATLVVMFIYQGSLYCNEVHSQQMELKYKREIGSKGTAEGQFMFPHSLAVDDFGNIYVGDTGNNRIQKFSQNGTFLIGWGTAGSNDSQFQGLHDIALGPNGKFV